MLSKKDILRICEIQEVDIDPRSIPSCFGLSDPRDERCFKKGKARCLFSSSCVIFMAELFGLKNIDFVSIQTLSWVTEEWEKYENKKLDDSMVKILEEKILKTIHSTKTEVSEDVKEMVSTSITNVGEMPLKIKEISKEVAKNLPKDNSLEPSSKRGTALYFAEEFWLKYGGTEEECIKYVEEKVGKSGKFSVASIKSTGRYPYRLVEYETGKFRLIAIDWM